MTMNDPISDMLTRIRNAQKARKTMVEMPVSKLKLKIAEILKKEGFVESFEEKEEAARKVLVLKLKYINRQPAIQGIDRESTPGHRVYLKATELPRVLNGYGIAIISTSKGLLTNKEARKLGLGGEIICSVY